MITYDYMHLNKLPKHIRQHLARKIFGPTFRLYVADRDYDLCMGVVSAVSEVGTIKHRLMLKIDRPDVVVTFDNHPVYFAPCVSNICANITVHDLTFRLSPGVFGVMQLDDDTIWCPDCGIDLSHQLPPAYWRDGDCTPRHCALSYSALTAYTAATVIKHCIYYTLITDKYSNAPPTMRSDQFANSLTAATRLHERFVLQCIYRVRISVLQNLPRDVFLLISRMVSSVHSAERMQ